MGKKEKMKEKESLQRIIEIQQAEHKKNQNRIKWGIRCVILIPILFMILMFTMETSKYVYLSLWVASMFIISAYLIYVEYADYKIQETMIKLGIKDDSIEELLPENMIDARLNELSEKIAQSQLSIAASIKEQQKLQAFKYSELEQKDEISDELMKELEGALKEEVRKNMPKTEVDIKAEKSDAKKDKKSKEKEDKLKSKKKEKEKDGKTKSKKKDKEKDDKSKSKKKDKKNSDKKNSDKKNLDKKKQDKKKDKKKGEK